MVTEEQLSFAECVKPLIKTLPESKKDISKHTGVPVSVINDLMSSKKTISQQHLHRLVDYFNCTYEYLQWDDGHSAHSFSLTGGYTTFPEGKKQIIDLYDQNSHGGDLVFAHELVHSRNYKIDHTRYILLHTCYHLYTLMIVKNQSSLLDELISKDMLINFEGERVASEDMIHELHQHEFNLLKNTELRRDIDEEFFSDKRLAFSQIPLSIGD